MVCRSSCAESQRNQVLFQKDPEASDSRDARGIPSDKSFSVTNEVCFGRLLPLLLRRREQSESSGNGTLAQPEGALGLHQESGSDHPCYCK
jgi:hypothetical protein